MSNISNFEKLINANNNLDNWHTNFTNFINQNSFIDYDEYGYFIHNNKIPDKLNFLFTLNIKLIFQYINYRKKYNEFFEYLKSFDLEEHNNTIANIKIQEFKNKYDKIEGKTLDFDQINAIVRENKNELVIASAGCGKTTTIVGKVKYLIENIGLKAKDILVLSFTKASADEMKDRIESEVKQNITACTFHKLGLDILRKDAKDTINVCEKSVYKIIINEYKNCLNNKAYIENTVNYWACGRVDAKDEFDFEDEISYREYLKINPPTTLNKEIVKSFGELEIANFLFMNNVKYEYEKNYKYNTYTDTHMQYKPDFYLPDYDIYIEYFGIDKNGNVAPYFRNDNGIDPSVSYNESIKWKRKTHEENSTTMIEAFYYEKKAGSLIENLKTNLLKNNVVLKEKDYKEIWDEVKKNNVGIESEMCNLFATIINLIKSNDYDINYVRDMCVNNKNYLLFLDLLTPLYNYYNSYLVDNNEIDFNDMINMATRKIERKEYIHKYKYVIVDEYQDISKSRYNLLKAMRNQYFFKLFCVGDDWQSIYRFNGSDVGLITCFEKYWGKSYITSITSTYRFSDKLAQISSDFIVKNPNQIKKSIHGLQTNGFPLSIANIKYENKMDEIIEEFILNVEKGSGVLLLGRYNHDINHLKNSTRFKVHFDNNTGNVLIISNARKDVKIEFMTIHKSKGLQGDYVIILNNRNDGLGFPSKIANSGFVELLLEKSDCYPYSEERRLFYVAITRAKKKVVLITLSNKQSEFIDELICSYGQELYQLFDNKKTCPNCGGMLTIRESRYGKFIGCSNYPYCKYKDNIQ